MEVVDFGISVYQRLVQNPGIVNRKSGCSCCKFEFVGITNPNWKFKSVSEFCDRVVQRYNLINLSNFNLLQHPNYPDSPPKI